MTVHVHIHQGAWCSQMSRVGMRPDTFPLSSLLFLFHLQYSHPIHFLFLSSSHPSFLDVPFLLLPPHSEEIPLYLSASEGESSSHKMFVVKEIRCDSFPLLEGKDRISRSLFLLSFLFREDWEDIAFERERDGRGYT